VLQCADKLVPIYGPLVPMWPNENQTYIYVYIYIYIYIMKIRHIYIYIYIHIYIYIYICCGKQCVTTCGMTEYVCNDTCHITCAIASSALQHVI